MTLMEILKSFYESIERVGEEDLNARSRELSLPSLFLLLLYYLIFTTLMQRGRGKKIIVNLSTEKRKDIKV
jgi:hypothetical protein